MLQPKIVSELTKNEKFSFTFIKKFYAWVKQ